MYKVFCTLSQFGKEIPVDQVGEIDGYTQVNLYLVWTDNRSSEPIMDQWVYSCGRYYAHGVLAMHNKPVKYLGNGRFEYNLKEYQFDDGPASRREQIPIPRPKVRAGIEVRYYDGQWQKRLKNGWVTA